MYFKYLVYLKKTFIRFKSLGSQAAIIPIAIVPDNLHSYILV